VREIGETQDAERETQTDGASRVDGAEHEPWH